MRNLLARLIITALVVVAVVSLVPTSAAAAGDPSTTQPVANDTGGEPPLPSPTPPPDPPHVPVTYTVGTYIDKSYDATDGAIKAVNVRKLEDVTYIANKLNLTTDEIKYSNPDKDVTTLKEGDTLTVPPVHGVAYKVQDGDTLSWIATSFSVDLNALEAYNNITDPDHISHDNIFIIPGAKLPQIQRPVPSSVYSPVNVSYGTVAPVVRSNGSSVGNHFYFGFCTWYVANRRPIPWFGDAIQWWPNARAMGYPEGNIPRPGAILVEAPNHVAYVESVGNGSFVVSEMNFKAWNVVDYRTISMGDRSIVGFIY